MHVDGPTMNEAQLVQEVLHDDVVAMGVNAKVSTLIEGPLETEASSAPYGSIRGYTVHNAIRFVPNPVPIVDVVVGRLDTVAVVKEKGTNHA